MYQDAYPMTASTLGNTKIDSSPFNYLSEVGGAIQQLEQRVNSLRDKLVGSQPEQAVGEGIPTSSGLFGAVSDSAQMYLRCIAEMNSALSQIEKKLP